MLELTDCAKFFSSPIIGPSGLKYDGVAPEFGDGTIFADGISF